MATELYAVADSKIYIGGALSTKKADFVHSDFSSQTWVEIDGWETCGAIGDAAEVITTVLINRGRALKQKGTNNAGSMENTFAVIDGNAGQTALAAAQVSNDDYAFKIEWSTGEVWEFVGLVVSKARAGGDANSVHKISATIEINSNIAES